MDKEQLKQLYIKVKLIEDMLQDISGKLKLEIDAESLLNEKKLKDEELLDIIKKGDKKLEKISTSYLQRKFAIGYARASRLMEIIKKDIGDEIISDK